MLRYEALGFDTVWVADHFYRAIGVTEFIFPEPSAAATVFERVAQEAIQRSTVSAVASKGAHDG